MKELAVYFAKVITQSKDHNKYAVSRKKKIDNHIDDGVFISTTCRDAKGYCIYGYRSVHYVMYEAARGAYEKARIINQPFEEEQDILMHAPTVMRVSKQFLCASSAEIDLSLKKEQLIFKIRDVEQEVFQAKDKL